MSNTLNFLQDDMEEKILIYLIIQSQNKLYVFYLLPCKKG